jgi:hypothetical protein
MGVWRLGYAGLLDIAGSYDAGKELYKNIGIIPIGFYAGNAGLMCRAVGLVNGTPSTVTMTADNITNYPNFANTTFSGAPTAFETDEFNLGFVRFLSGACENKVYKITDTTASTLVSSTNLQTAGVDNNDMFEVVTGGSVFTFPSGRNPIRRDFKRTFKGASVRFGYYEGGMVTPIGFEADDMVIMTHVTDERDADRLELMLNHLLDYKGFDGIYTTSAGGAGEGQLAPMVLETGSADIRNQYLVYLNNYKIVKDAKRSDGFWEIMIHLQDFTRNLYRGI